MAVDDRRLAPIVLCPRLADREPVLVGLSGRVAVEGERSHGSGGPAVHVRGQSRVSDDEAPVIEQVVADESVDELGNLGRELRRLNCQLLKAPVEPVSDGDIAAL
jgi:hypothetical protein